MPKPKQQLQPKPGAAERPPQPRTGIGWLARQRWTAEQPPAEMLKLPPKLRRKAVEIANELLSQRLDEATVLRIAIAKARAWALEQQHLGDPDLPA